MSMRPAKSDSTGINPSHGMLRDNSDATSEKMSLRKFLIIMNIICLMIFITLKVIVIAQILHL